MQTDEVFQRNVILFFMREEQAPPLPRIAGTSLAFPLGKVSAKPTDEVFQRNVTPLLCGGSKPPPYTLSVDFIDSSPKGGAITAPQSIETLSCLALRERCPEGAERV